MKLRVLSHESRLYQPPVFKRKHIRRDFDMKTSKQQVAISVLLAASALTAATPGYAQPTVYPAADAGAFNTPLYNSDLPEFGQFSGDVLGPHYRANTTDIDLSKHYSFNNANPNNAELFAQSLSGAEYPLAVGGSQTCISPISNNTGWCEASATAGGQAAATDQTAVSAVPLPGAGGLLAAGLIAISALGRRRLKLL